MSNIRTRDDKDNFYLHLAKIFAERGTCIYENYGAILVNTVQNKIVGHGYTGVPNGLPHCAKCTLSESERQTGHNCRSVHAVANSLLHCADTSNCVLYLYGIRDGKPIDKPVPCNNCMNLLLQTGVKKIIVYSGDQLVETHLDEIRMQLKVDYMISEPESHDISHYVNPAELPNIQ